MSYSRVTTLQQRFAWTLCSCVPRRFFGDMPLKQYFVCQVHPLAAVMSTMIINVSITIIAPGVKTSLRKTRVPLGVPLHTPVVRVPHLRTTALLNWPDLSSGGFYVGVAAESFPGKVFQIAN